MMNDEQKEKTEQQTANTRATILRHIMITGLPPGMDRDENDVLSALRARETLRHGVEADNQAIRKSSI